MKWILLSLALAVCIGELTALECYTCAYVATLPQDQSCMDPFNASSSQPTTTCEGECIKTTASLNGEIVALSRACSPVCPAGCASASGQEACVYCCSGDKCNGAGAVTFGLVTVAVATLLGWAVSK
jgi:hypothetical protein